MINIFNLFMGNKEEQPGIVGEILVFNLIILEAGRATWELREGESYDLAGV